MCACACLLCWMPNQKQTKIQKSATIIMNVCICTTMPRQEKEKKTWNTCTIKKSTMQKILLFAPLAPFSSHKTPWMPSNVRLCLCLWATLRFVFMSKAHFLFWLSLLYYSHLCNFFCFGHVLGMHSAHSTRYPVVLCSFSWWYGKRQRCVILLCRSGWYRRICCLLVKRPSRSYSHNVGICAVLVPLLFYTKIKQQTGKPSLQILRLWTWIDHVMVK